MVEHYTTIPSGFYKAFLPLQVSVPCSSLLDIVTVRCGHCTNLWSVNMAAVFQQLSRQDQIQVISTSYNLLQPIPYIYSPLS